MGITMEPDVSWRVLVPGSSAWLEPFNHGFRSRKPVYCGGDAKLTLCCWLGRSCSLLAQRQRELWWGARPHFLPSPSKDVSFHFVAWVLPSLPHLLEDPAPCCLENPA